MISIEKVPGEREVVESVRIDDAWSLVEEFSTLVRESGTEEEREAVDRITSRLEGWGVPFTVHEPELFISLPRRASLRAGDRTYEAKTPTTCVSDVTFWLLYFSSRPVLPRS